MRQAEAQQLRKQLSSAQEEVLDLRRQIAEHQRQQVNDSSSSLVQSVMI
jgi:hypothetical protein